MILVFDIGGTWIRAGLYKNTLLEKTTLRKSLAEIKSISGIDDKISYICALVNEICTHENFKDKFHSICISFGACLNTHTGKIYESAPLFGDNNEKVDISEIFLSKIIFKNITIINDLVALCYGHVAEGRTSRSGLFTAITVSSGIAMRTFDLDNMMAISDPKLGIQGEIGHLPIFNPHILGDHIPFCACGKPHHLSAYSSGQGIDSFMRAFLHNNPRLANTVLAKSFAAYNVGTLAISESIIANEEIGHQILESITYPLTLTISTIISINPLINKIILSGGVIESLGDKILPVMERQLEGILYIYRPIDIMNRILLCKEAQFTGMIGAGYYLKKNRTGESLHAI